MTTAAKPDVYFFNPTCEYAVANGTTSWQPNRLLQKMEQDLGTLPLFLANPNDIVLVRKLPAAGFLQNIENQGIKLPRFVQLDDALKNKLNGEELNRLLPWGWSPAMHKLLEPLKENCSSSFLKSPVAGWEPAHREFYSKKFALGILQNVLPLLPGEKAMPLKMLPGVVTTKKEMENLIGQWGKLMIKAPWSSSGRGLQPITKTPVVPKVWEKLMGIVSAQGYAIAEPLLDKVLDMALQFELKNGKATYLGSSRFITDPKGQYQGNLLGDPVKYLSEEIKNFANEIPLWLAGPLKNAIEKSRLPKLYEGYFGIDTLLFYSPEGNLKINPCLEINLRQNMGLLSFSLQKIVAPGSAGMFKTHYQKGKPFHLVASEMRKKHPPHKETGKMAGGFFPVTPVEKDALFGAYLLLEKHP